jgi:hypothetical protein
MLLSLRRWVSALSRSVRGRISELMLSEGARIACQRSPSPTGFPAPIHYSWAYCARFWACRRSPSRRSSLNGKVYRLKGSPAAFIGVVYAPDEKAAHKAAVKEFKIQQDRLLVRRA